MLVEVFVSLCGCLSEVVAARLFARSLCVCLGRPGCVINTIVLSIVYRALKSKNGT